MIPFFSIITPTYNKATTLGRTIESVLTQTFKEFELIIVDDGSTDDTEAVVMKYKDERVRYYRKDNSGVTSSRNFGVKKSIGLYLIFLDGDDFFDSCCLAKFYEKAKTLTVDMVFCYSTLMDDITGEKKEISKYQVCNTKAGPVKFSNLVGTFIVARKLFLQSSGFNECLRFSENYEFVTRLLFYHQPSVEYIRESLVTFGNSLDPSHRNSKFSQALMRASFHHLMSVNKEFWRYNSKQFVFLVRRSIVANVVLSNYKAAMTLLIRYLFQYPTQLIRFIPLLMFPTLYRSHLISKGFKP